MTRISFIIVLVLYVLAISLLELFVKIRTWVLSALNWRLDLYELLSSIHIRKSEADEGIRDTVLGNTIEQWTSLNFILTSGVALKSR